MRVLATGIAMLVVVCSCRTSPKPAQAYHPRIDAATVTTKIDNPYMTLRPGITFRYTATVERATELNDVTVSRDTAMIMGVRAVVVHDVVRRAGHMTEDTIDWYAQDAEGNVWYMGESTKKYENGKWTTEGSWRGGVDGAQPGIIMEAHPRVGDHYRQEYYKGHAEDEARVVATNTTLDVGGRSYTQVIVTRETSALEPDVVEQKYYTPGIGFVYLKTTKGPREEQRLVSVTG